MSKARVFKIVFALILALIILFLSYKIWGDKLLLKASYMYMEYGDEEGALKSYENALRINNNNKLAHLELIRYYGINNDAENLDKAIENAVLALPDEWEIYVEASKALVRIDEIEKASQLLSTIENEYVGQKIGNMRPQLPGLTPTPGTYDKSIDIKVSGALTYIKINDEPFKKYEDTIHMDFGKYKISAISVDVTGLVSDISEAYYILGREETEIVFKDEVFENEVRDLLNKPTGDILNSELWEIESLTLKNTEQIEDFSDLEHFISLKHLKTDDISSCHELDLSIFQDLESIHIENGISTHVLNEIIENKTISNLSLNGCSLKNIPDISQMLSLTSLNLSGNDIEEIVLNHEYLKEVDLSYNKISTVKNISGLSSVETFDISYNDINNLYELKEKSSLKNLNVEGNEISDISPLESLDNLVYCNLSYNNIENTTPLKNLSKLETLNLSHNSIENINMLTNLTSLNYFDVSYNKLSDLPHFRGMHSLKYLSIKENDIEDLSPIIYVTSLSVLDISDNNLKTLDVLESCENLKHVFLSENDYSVIESITVSAKIIID